MLLLFVIQKHHSCCCLTINGKDYAFDGVSSFYKNIIGVKGKDQEWTFGLRKIAMKFQTRTLCCYITEQNKILEK